MKAKRYTIAMLIALMFASAGIQAQSARRPVAQEKKERARTASTYKRETSGKKAKATQVHTQHTRDAQPAKTNRGQQVQKKQKAYKKPASNNNKRQYTHSKQTVKTNHENQAHKRVSMTTNKNPRSTYGKANKITYTDHRYNAPVKSNTYHKRGYYGGHHYHYAYPTKRVKIHYHNNTYVNRYRALYYPAYGDIYWTRNMYRDYHRWYPGFRWSYSYGHRIQTISVFDAKYNLGEVAMVYGRVYATWHNNETDDFLLFFGGEYPYQQFTVVVPGHIARKYSWRPEKYFLGEHVTVTGLITTFDGSPEIVIKNRRQLDLY